MGIRNHKTSATTNNINMKVIIALSALFAVAAAIPAGPPAYGAPPAYGKAPVYEDTPPVYAYEYGVADDYSKANFGQNEKRDGYATSGSYRVALPDGRTQIVTYGTADAYSGNVAQVVYEGTAHYGPGPAYKPAPHAAPAYKPAPYHA